MDGLELLTLMAAAQGICEDKGHAEAMWNDAMVHLIAERLNPKGGEELRKLVANALGWKYEIGFTAASLT